MRILLVGNSSYAEKVIAVLTASDTICRSNIIVRNDIEEAKVFIQNNVENNSTGKHIDLIVADDVITGNVYQKNLCDWLRSSSGKFSDANFRLSSIPIILLKNDIGEKTLKNTSYNAIVPLTGDSGDVRIITKCCSVVKVFRSNILDDLSNLNIDLALLDALDIHFGRTVLAYKSISDNPDYYFTRTAVLSKEFIHSPRRLNYEWLSKNFIQIIEQSLYEYNQILKRITSYTKGYGYERGILHVLYNKYPHILLRDIYEAQFYEHRFGYSKSNSYVPDYILKSPFPDYINTSISEIKRPHISFEYKPKQHQPLTNYAQKSLYQSSSYQDVIPQIFGCKCQMDLIIGLKSALTDSVLKTLEKHFSTINLITHNEMFERLEIYYHNQKRMNAVSI